MDPSRQVSALDGGGDVGLCGRFARGRTPTVRESLGVRRAGLRAARLDGRAESHQSRVTVCTRSVVVPYL